MRQSDKNARLSLIISLLGFIIIAFMVGAISARVAKLEEKVTLMYNSYTYTCTNPERTCDE